MQKHVPFFMLSLCFSLCAFADPQPPSWRNYRTTVGCENPPQNPATDADKMLALRCQEARRAYCAGHVGGNESCDLTSLPNSGTKEQITGYIKTAARNCGDTAKQAKEKCINSQGDTRGPVGKETLQAMCQQLTDSTARAEAVNTAVGGTCQGMKGRCDALCTSAKNSIDQMITACGADCADLKNLNEYKTLQTAQPVCAAVNPDQVLAQARTTNTANSIADQCRSLTNAGNPGIGSSAPGGRGSNPSGSTAATKDAKPASAGSGMDMGKLLPLAMMAMQMMNQQPQQQPQQPPVNPSLDQVDCSVNPNLAGCPAAAAGTDSWNAKTASVAASGDSPAGGDFNPADDNSMTPASVDGPAETKAGTPPTVGGVPNGGGGMPGGGGGGAASLGGGGGGGGGVAGKNLTDVLHGMSAGGGGMSAMNANMNMKNGESGGGYTYGQGGYGNSDAGLDLSQFLPGGKQDPTRKIAGIAAGGPGNFQIQSKNVNIWSRISERIKARCSQGLLRDCIP